MSEDESEESQKPSEVLIQRLFDLGPAIEDSLRREDNTPEDIALLERFRVVLTFFGKRLDGADESLLHPRVTGEVAEHVEVATSAVKAFVESGDFDQLVSADNAINEAIEGYAALIFPSGVDELQGLRDAAKKYRSSLLRQAKGYAQQVVVVRQKVENLASGVEELRTKLEFEGARLEEKAREVEDGLLGKHGELVAKFNELQTTLHETQKEAIDGLAAKLEAFQTEQEELHREAIEAHEEARSELQKDSSAAFQEKVDEWSAAIQVASEQSKAEISNLTAEFAVRSRELVSEIQDNLTRASELVGIIGERAVTSGHKKAADEARWQVRLWQFVAVVAMGGLVAFAGATVLGWLPNRAQLGSGARTQDALHANENSESSFWHVLAGRIYFSVAIGVLATYAASQVNRYQQIERRNRKLELELKALEPFLEPVSPDQREMFRLKMAEAFFGRDDGGKEGAGPANVAQLLRSKETMEAVGEAIKTIIEKVKS